MTARLPSPKPVRCDRPQATGTFIATVTIIPFMSEGWDIAARGFPAMTGNVPFLMRDVVMLAVSF
jgi:hypothetical protein